MRGEKVEGSVSCFFDTSRKGWEGPVGNLGPPSHSPRGPVPSAGDDGAVPAGVAGEVRCPRKIEDHHEKMRGGDPGRKSRKRRRATADEAKMAARFSITFPPLAVLSAPHWPASCSSPLDIQTCGIQECTRTSMKAVFCPRSLN